MNERIKKVRIGSGLNQTDFGARIGVTQGAVAAYEIGRRVPLDAIIKAICEKYGVREEWLRTGKGEMYIPKSEEEEIADIVARFFEEHDPRKRKVVRWFLGLDDDELKLLEDFARYLLGEDE